jgi:hypothetical protein
MSTIKLKRSAVPGRVPIPPNLELGEIGINTYDGKLYIKKNVGGVESIISFDGTVSGSSVDQSTVYLDTGTGNGTTTNFTLSYPASAKQKIFVYLNGVLQHASEYEFSGTTLTFYVAPASGDLIEVRTIANISTSVSIRYYKTFVYTFTSSQSTFSGLDDNGVTIAYDRSRVEVYLKGVRLVDNSDFTATNDTSIVLATSVSSGTLEIVSLAKAAFADHDALKPGGAVFGSQSSS